jgi:16S rRNA (guanine527-N7)-methyltransferase
MDAEKKFANFYLQQLSSNYLGLNLTRIINPDDFFEKQILDSLYPFTNDKSLLEKVYELGYLVDIGFGGGFPILPLRNFISDEVKILGVDSRRKKVDAVRSISNEYHQENIQFKHERIENIHLDIPCFLTLKAVGDVRKMLKLINCIEGSWVMFYKAKNFEELEPNYKNIPGYKFIKINKFEVGSNERCVVIYQKLKTHAKDKLLVKLSDIVFN